MVNLSYASRKLQKCCTNEKHMIRSLGPRMAEELQTRLAELEGAETLDDMRYYPQARCHELKENRKGQLAVDLEHHQRRSGVKGG